MIAEEGSTADNFYIHTPICCPSRSETFTGRYLHNVKKAGQCPEGYNGHDDQGNACCMHVDEVLVNNFTMARYMKEQAGYTVGMFGKYLNVCPQEPPPGFDAWFANGGGTYYSPEFSVKNIDGLPDGSWKGNATDYTTALVGNHSVAWIRKVVTEKKQPFLAFINPKACHEPFLPAPWYKDYWHPSWPAMAPRPPSFNTTKEQRANHHPTIANMDLLTEETTTCIDDTFRNRWRTLMSVDDVISEVISVTEELGVADNTYFLYSSDHGFQLGELNLAMDKRNVYEFDIKIHLVARGPGIKKGSHLTQPASNVDLAPTIMGLGGLTVQTDGKSLVPLLVDKSDPALPESVRRHIDSAPTAPWRDHVFVEYYYVGIGNKCGQKHPIEEQDNNFIALRYTPGSRYGNILYAEFQNGTDGFVAFDSPHFYELYDMDKDPWQLNNIYNTTTPAVRDALHRELHQWLACKGAACP
eukprot:Sspe_Gene.2428::Locus_806_Transcript_1_1_Confidence_1.000_Length_1824::g.2428::m.2428/K01137/GNS; N-acetylglucosamine-6-sulfatase